MLHLVTSAGGPLLAASGAPSGHVTPMVLFGWFQTGWSSQLVDAVLAAAAAAYLVGVLRLRDAGRRWRPQRTAAHLAGLLAVFVAVGSGLAAYDDLNPSAHVLQHVLLMMVAPPLLVAGRPLVLAAQALPRTAQRRVVAVAAGRAVRVATGPLSWVLYYGSMAGYFLSPAYAESVGHEWFHETVHGWFFLVGCLFWTGLATGDGPQRRSHAFRLLAVLAGMPLEAALGLTLVVWPHPLVAGTTLAATHRAGQVFWMSAMVASGVVLAGIMAQWIAADTRRVERWEAGAVRPTGPTTDAVPGGPVPPPTRPAPG